MSLVFWTYVFVVASYFMAATCLWRGMRKGHEQAGWGGVLRELLAFATIVFSLFLVESWAQLRAPYLVYSTTFPDLAERCRFSGVVNASKLLLHSYGAMLPPWTVRLLDLSNGPSRDTCTHYVTGLAAVHHRIPRSVIAFEASLVYAGMWTARRVTRSLALQPLLAGLALLLIDLLVDPVVAISHRCDGKLTARGNGVGLWNWYLEGNGRTAHLFDVPAFNYAAWLGAPIMVIALINVFPFWREGLRRGAARLQTGRIARMRWLGPCVRWVAAERKQPVEVQHVWSWGIFMILIVAAFVILSAPSVTKDLPALQYAALYGGTAIVIGLLVWRLNRTHAKRPVDARLLIPAMVGLSLALAAGLERQRFVVRPWLMPVALAAPVLSIALHLLPYRELLRRLVDRGAAMERALGLRHFGLTSVLLLFGASLAHGGSQASLVPGLLSIACFFHLYCYASQQVVELTFGAPTLAQDRGTTQPDAGTRRATGLLRPASVLCAGVVVLLLTKGDPTRVAWGLSSLGAAVLLVRLSGFAGNAARRSARDWLQGLAWGALALVGAAVGAHSQALDLAHDLWRSQAWLLAYGALYIALSGAARTGAPGRDGARANEWTGFYVQALNALMFASLAALVGLNGALLSGTRLYVAAAVLLGFVVVGALKLRRPHASGPAQDRGALPVWYPLLRGVPVILLFGFARGPALAFKVAALISLVAPLFLVEPVVDWIRTLAVGETRTQKESSHGRKD